MATIYVKDLPFTQELPFAQERSEGNSYSPVSSNVIEYSSDVMASIMLSEHTRLQTANAAEMHKIEPFSNSADPTYAAVNWLKGHIEEVEDENKNKPLKDKNLIISRLSVLL